MRIEDIEYDVEGHRMVGRLAVDDYRVGPRPGVLLCHEGPGIDEHVRGRAVRLAALGYVAFALDYHGDGQVLPQGEVMERLGALNRDAARTRRLARAGLDVLLAQSEVDAQSVAAIGYCFGGGMVLELARDGADLEAVVGFHPGFSPPNVADARRIKASVLMCCGADDPFASHELRQGFETEMREAGVADWRLDLYGGVGHSFTNPKVDEFGIPGVAFDEAAERRSWRAMLDLFEERLGTPA